MCFPPLNKIGADKMPTASGELRQWQLELVDLMKEFGPRVMALAKEYFKAGKDVDEYAL